MNPGPTDYDSAALTTELIRHTQNRKRQHFAFEGMACQDQKCDLTRVYAYFHGIGLHAFTLLTCNSPWSYHEEHYSLCF